MKRPLYTLGLAILSILPMQQPIQAQTVSRQVDHPVIYSDVPDISILRHGDTYYMSSTTMHCAPGVPLMKSHDLVNWQMVNYAYDILADVPELNLEDGKSTYGRGSWASCLRYVNGLYYLSTFAQTTDKTYIYTTPDIEKGPWTRHEFAPAYHDHSIVYEEDGHIYMIYGNGCLRMVEVKPDLSGVVEGTDRVVIENAGLVAGPEIGLNAEGSQLFKHDGKYYLFNIVWPRGGMRTVICHRADSIYGPYEGRVVFQDRGIAQGGIVDTPDGQWYAYLFQDHGAVGRVPYMIPMQWTDGWPVMGDDTKMPASIALPETASLIPGIVDNDEFSRQEGDRALPLVWQWNHNPDSSLWSVSARTGYLRLTTGALTDDFEQARNTLTQRTIGPKCTAQIRLEIHKMKDGDFAGLGILQERYGQVGIKQEGKKRYLVMVNGETRPVKEVARVELGKAKAVCLKAACDFTDRLDEATFYYSLDGQTWHALGNTLHMKYTLTHFMGARFALFNYASRHSGGYVDFDYFHIEEK
jgi:beta-xylosidase